VREGGHFNIQANILVVIILHYTHRKWPVTPVNVYGAVYDDDKKIIIIIKNDTDNDDEKKNCL